MGRRTAMAAGLLVGNLEFAGCGTEATEGGWSQEAAPYAVYASRLPLYRGTKIEVATGSGRSGADGGSSSCGMTWWCTVEATRDELRTAYEARLPAAARETTEEGHLVLTVVLEGAGPRERVGVLIEGTGRSRPGSSWSLA